MSADLNVRRRDDRWFVRIDNSGTTAKLRCRRRGRQYRQRPLHHRRQARQASVAAPGPAELHRRRRESNFAMLTDPEIAGLGAATGPEGEPAVCNPLTCQALSRTRTGDLLLTGK